MLAASSCAGRHTAAPIERIAQVAALPDLTGNTGAHIRVRAAADLSRDIYTRTARVRIWVPRSTDFNCSFLVQDQTGMVPRMLVVFAALTGVVLLAGLWVMVLRRQVDVKEEARRTILESTADGILVVDSAGRVVTCNQKFAETWGIPGSLLAAGDDGRLLDEVLPQLRDPDAFLSLVRRLYADPERHSDDVIEFKDGRIFERHSEP
jgi:PAS domain-containing protein